MTGFTDLFVILVILVIVFGATWMPRTGAAIGRALARSRARREQGSQPPAEVSAKAAPPTAK